MTQKRTTKTLKTSSKKAASRKAISTRREPVVRIVSDEEIANLAYALWEQRGRPLGTPEEDWHNARTQLHSERTQL